MQCVKSVALSTGAVVTCLLSLSSFAAAFDRATEREESYRVQTVSRYERRQTERMAYVPATRRSMGGGFIEALFGGGEPQGRSQGAIYGPEYATGEPRYTVDPMERGHPYIRSEPGYQQHSSLFGGDPDRPAMDPRYRKQVVDYDGKHAAGTIIIDTPNKFLYLVQGGGKALRYGIGVGRPGFTWAGVKTVSAKKEWPDWRPPDEMLRRRPDLPRYMPGGPDNPLGARALYLGSTLYRIHGSNEPWTIGTQVSSGCIRMRNEDVVDLYERVPVGAKVIVM
jgi:lipoprotein-anchoring transpeptidase ErfK/SrfK